MDRFVRVRPEAEVLKEKLEAALARAQRLYNQAEKFKDALGAELAAFDAQGVVTTVSNARAAHFDQFQGALTEIVALADTSSSEGGNDPGATLRRIQLVASRALNPPLPPLSPVGRLLEGIHGCRDASIAFRKNSSMVTQLTIRVLTKRLAFPLPDERTITYPDFWNDEEPMPLYRFDPAFVLDKIVTIEAHDKWMVALEQGNSADHRALASGVRKWMSRRLAGPLYDRLCAHYAGAFAFGRQLRGSDGLQLSMARTYGPPIMGYNDQGPWNIDHVDQWIWDAARNNWIHRLKVRGPLQSLLNKSARAFEPTPFRRGPFPLWLPFAAAWTSEDPATINAFNFSAIQGGLIDQPLWFRDPRFAIGYMWGVTDEEKDTFVLDYEPELRWLHRHIAVTPSLMTAIRVHFPALDLQQWEYRVSRNRTRSLNTSHRTSLFGFGQLNDVIEIEHTRRWVRMADALDGSRRWRLELLVRGFSDKTVNQRLADYETAVARGWEHALRTYTA